MWSCVWDEHEEHNCGQMSNNYLKWKNLWIVPGLCVCVLLIGAGSRFKQSHWTRVLHSLNEKHFILENFGEGGGNPTKKHLKKWVCILKSVFINLDSELQDLYNIVISVSLKILIKLESLAFMILNTSKAIIKIVKRCWSLSFKYLNKAIIK